jgi:hypothetical protein
MTPKTQIRPEGFQIRSDVATTGDIQTSIAETQSASPNQPRQAKASQVWAAHALLMQTFVNGCFSANPLPRDCSRSAEKAEHFCTPNNPFRRVAPSDRSLRAITAFPHQSERAVSGQAEAGPSAIEQIVGVAPADPFVNTTSTAAV